MRWLLLDVLQGSILASSQNDAYGRHVARLLTGFIGHYWIAAIGFSLSRSTHAIPWATSSADGACFLGQSTTNGIGVDGLVVDIPVENGA